MAACQWWNGVDKNAMCQRRQRPGKTVLVAYAHVSAQRWQVSQTLGERNGCAAGGEIRCPTGWTPDGNGPGNNKCKQIACMLHSTPPPPNNTPIGNSGFTWGSGIWQWGPAISITPVTLRACP